MTVTYSNDSTVKQSKIGNGQWQNYTGAFSVSENGTICFRAQDAAGNESTSKLTVSNIDKNIPSAPALTSDMGKNWSNQRVMIFAESATDTYTIEYSPDGEIWADYPAGGVRVEKNGEYYFRAIDTAGNISAESSYVVDKIDPVAGTAVIPVIRENDNSYSYKASAATRGTLNITAGTGTTEFIRFGTVNVAGEGVTVKCVTGGKSSSSETLKRTVNKKGTVTDTEKFNYTSDVAGSFSTADNAGVESVSVFSTVALTNATVKNISGGMTAGKNGIIILFKLIK